jgi:hypothetical protein
MRGGAGKPAPTPEREDLRRWNPRGGSVFSDRVATSVRGDRIRARGQSLEVEFSSFHPSWRAGMGWEEEGNDMQVRSGRETGTPWFEDETFEGGIPRAPAW